MALLLSANVSKLSAFKANKSSRNIKLVHRFPATATKFAANNEQRPNATFTFANVLAKIHVSFD